VDRRVRASTPGPGAWTVFRGERLKLGPVCAVADTEPLTPGQIEVQRSRVLVGTGTGPVALGEIRAAGKRGMPALDWARGVRPASGEGLG
jgi:methionyl-tRNA formyltransferase